MMAPGIYPVSTYRWRHCVTGKKMAVFTVCRFKLEMLPQLNIKAVHNLKAKSLGTILTLWAMFVPISAFLLFLVSDVVCEE